MTTLAAREAHRTLARLDHDRAPQLRLDRQPFRRAASPARRTPPDGRPARTPAETPRSAPPAPAPPSSASPSATTRCTSPIAIASCESTSRPLRIRSSARPSPTMCGSRCVPPSISGTPQRRSRHPNCALAPATRMSHQHAISSPPATHHPSIAAIVGFGECSRVNPIGPSGASRPDCSSPSGPRPRRTPSRPPPSPPARAPRRPRRTRGSAVQQLRRRPVDGIPPLRPVDRQHRRSPDAFVFHTHAERSYRHRAEEQAPRPTLARPRHKWAAARSLRPKIQPISVPSLLSRCGEEVAEGRGEGPRHSHPKQKRAAKAPLPITTTNNYKLHKLPN